ncbi:hypothetical protein PRIPAC_76243, partial [Pristionchus pacificus]|uniref:Uncharacterized protein n=1 Tax=Pristionchus pacificus TaxID=54126 RepID=A0A2A6CS74_PRIPA
RALIVVACLICVTLQIVQLEHHDHRSYLTFNLDGTRDRTKLENRVRYLHWTAHSLNRGYGDPKYPLLEYKLIEFYYNPNVHVEKVSGILSNVSALFCSRFPGNVVFEDFYLEHDDDDDQGNFDLDQYKGSIKNVLNDFAMTVNTKNKDDGFRALKARTFG